MMALVLGAWKIPDPRPASASSPTIGQAPTVGGRRDSPSSARAIIASRPTTGSGSRPGRRAPDTGDTSAVASGMAVRISPAVRLEWPWTCISRKGAEKMMVKRPK